MRGPKGRGAEGAGTPQWSSENSCHQRCHHSEAWLFSALILWIPCNKYPWRLPNS